MVLNGAIPVGVVQFMSYRDDFTSVKVCKLTWMFNKVAKQGSLYEIIVNDWFLQMVLWEFLLVVNSITRMSQLV